MVGSGFDGHFANLGDWMPDTPSPRTLFSAVLDRGNANQNICLEDPIDEHKQVDGSGDKLSQFSTSPSPEQQKLSFQGRLVDRMAARAGFNAPRLNTESIRSSDLLANQNHSNAGSPYLTIPPGLSPTTLLESPVFLSNSLVQPSPTTGKFHILPNVNLTSLSAPDAHKDNIFEDINTSPFEFKPPAERGSYFPCNIVPPVELENSVQSHNQNRVPSVHNQNRVPSVQSDIIRKDTGDDNSAMEEDDEGDQRVSGDGIVFSEDGYNWRKYGQKQVKGSDYPRSYYKCTHSTCPIKKKVERSHAGHITEIIYKGMHNHAKPPLNRRSVSTVGSGSLAGSEMMQVESGDGDVVVWANPQNTEVTSSTSLDVSSNFSNDEDDDDRGTHGSVSLGYDAEGDESESKRRKIESELIGAEMNGSEMGGATRAVRKPRVVVQTTSEVDILDDGYRWRKYGQKVVKGNPNPRSYYKCTNSGCDVRKHVERASHDFKSVITTYEGKHNHDIPAARNGNHPINPGVASTSAAASPEQPCVPMQCPNNNALRMMGPHFPFHQRQHHLDPNPGQGRGFCFGMDGQSVNPYFGEAGPRQMGFVMGREESKVEAAPDVGLNGVAIRGPSVYHQVMNRLPLGPQM